VAELGTVQNGAETARLSCSAVERMVCELWSDHFGHAISPYDDFFDLGGDSIALIDFVLVARQRSTGSGWDRAAEAMRRPHRRYRQRAQRWGHPS
jgi:hypothetical protein